MDQPEAPANPASPDFLAIAQVLGAHGTTGEIKARILTDFPQRFASLAEVFLDEVGPVRVRRQRIGGRFVLLQLDGYDTREAASTLLGRLVQVPITQAVALPEDTYYWHQIIGLEAWSDLGERLGRIEDILDLPSNDVYVVRDGEREILLPAIEEAILKVDLGTGQMIVHVLPGLMD